MARQPETTTDDVLAEFEELADYCEPLTAPEIADSLDVSGETAREKLKLCVELGELRMKRVGARALVFWRPCREG